MLFLCLSVRQRLDDTCHDVMWLCSSQSRISVHVTCVCWNVTMFATSASLCGYAVQSVCLLFVLSLCEQDYYKSNRLISLKLLLWLSLPMGRTDWLLMVMYSRIWILDHFFTSMEWGILGDLLAFLIQSPADFHDTRRNDWRRQGKESTTFWEQSNRHPD